MCTWQQGSAVWWPPLEMTMIGSRSGCASGGGGRNAVSAAAMPVRSCVRISATAASMEPPACTVGRVDSKWICVLTRSDTIEADCSVWHGAHYDPAA